MSYDPRFDEVAAEVDSARQWRNGADGAPNPIVIEATGWVGPIDTEYGPVELLVGTDRDGSQWSVMAGGMILQKTLIEGIMEEWDDEKKAFVQAAVLGKVKPGEMVGIKYKGKRDGGKFSYNDYEVSRKPAREGALDAATEEATATADDDDGVPF